MIFCTTKKPDQYTEQTPNGVNGLWTNYGHDPYLFNLLSRFSVAFYLYEPGFEFIPEGNRLAVLSYDDLYKETLECSIKGVPMRTLLAETTPREFESVVREGAKPEDLPLCRMFDSGNNLTEQALQVAWLHSYVRSLQHDKFYRGPLSVKGKVAYAHFSSTLTPEEDKFLETQKKLLLGAVKETHNGK